MNTLYPIITLFLFCLCFFTNAQNSSQPNIVIILADDLGYADVGYNGGDINTPNINRLSQKAIVFNRFYAHSTCTPSRVGLMSGRFAAREGLATSVITPKCGDGLNPELYILPEMLADAGYSKRSCIGKWHLGHSNIKYHPLKQGFTNFYGHYGGMIDYYTHKRAGQVDWHRDYDFCADQGYATDLITKEAVKQIGDWANIDSPFFMYVAYNAPHTPLQATPEKLDGQGFDPEKGTYKLTNDDKRKEPQIGRGNNKRQTYKAMVESLDDGVGQILKALEQHNVLNETIVIFYSDNGGYPPNGGDNGILRGTKGTYYEGGVRVPALVYYPTLIKNKTSCNNMVSHIDLFPTLMELANADSQKLEKKLDGVSLLPYFNGLTNCPNVDYNRILYLGKKALVTQRWKLINNELFDLENDPAESKNVAEQYPFVYNALIEKLNNLRTAIENPIVRNFDYKIKKNWEMPQ